MPAKKKVATKKAAPKKVVAKPVETPVEASDALPKGITRKDGVYYYGKLSSLKLDKLKRQIAKL
jgi:hypothetical protein